MDNNYKIEYWDKEKTKVKSEEWLNSKGERHRVDGPAVQSWYENGQKSYESWWLHDKRHRVDEPAFQSWYESGQKDFVSWWLDGKLHRVVGPAHQSWLENGQKLFEAWYLDGKELSEREFIILSRKRKLLNIKL